MLSIQCLMRGIATYAYVAMALPLISAASPPEMRPYIPVVVEIHVDGVAPTVVQALRHADTALVPLIDVLRVFHLPYVRREHDVVVRLGKRTLPIELGNDLIRDRDTLFISTYRLSTLFDIPIVVDWSELTITVTSATALPFMQRHFRQLQLQASRLSPLHTEATRDSAFVVSLAPAGGFSLAYNVFSTAHAPPAIHAAVGTTVFGGALSVKGTSRQMTWERQWDHHQLRVGSISDGVTTIGAMMSNTPVSELSTYDTTSITGLAASGEEIELYRDGVLDDFDSASVAHPYYFRLPLSYGLTEYTLVRYLPDDRTVSETWRTNIYSGLLPLHTIRYRASAGWCAREVHCRAAMRSHVAFAPVSHVTFDADAAIPRVSQRAQISARVLVTKTLFATLQQKVASGITLTTQYQPSRNVSASATYRRANRGAMMMDERVSTVLRRRAVMLSPFVRLSRDTGMTATVAHVGADLWGPLSATTLGATTLGATTLGMIRSVWLRSHVETDARHTDRRGRISNVLWSFDLGIVPVSIGGIHLESRTSWSAGHRAPMWTIIMNRRGEGLSVQNVATFARRRPLVTHAVDGAIAFDPVERRLVSASTVSVDASCDLVGVVFLDANGNGRRDSDELPLRDVELRIGDSSVITDSTGKYHASALVPFAPVTVVLDEQSLSDPALKAPHAMMRVVAVPNRYNRLDIPVVSSVVSSVVRDAARQ